MCGIVGLYTPGSPASQDLLRSMTDAIRHRGPDDHGFLVDGGVGLGMRRLSIIDVDGGAQPIGNEDGSVQTVFNGEIYNFRELRKELREAGHDFRTQTDTECIVHLYESLDAEFVQRLNGMFAIAVWDARRRRLLLARDRLGIKPLYYAWDGRRLIFASETKAILASGLIRKDLEQEALWHYLTFRYVPEPWTMWKGIRKLPPAHRMIMDLSVPEPEPRIERYWDIPYHDGFDRDLPYDEALEQFSELFVDSVRRRLIADVPVGIFLSGGLDSSAVAAAVAETHNASLGTFSVAFDEGGEFSEFSFARQVADHVGTNHTEVVIGYDDFIGFLPELAWATDDPLADPAAIPLGLLAREAVRHVKVVLSGEGADEVMAGYTFDRRVAEWGRLTRYDRVPGWVRALLPPALATLGADDLARRVRLRNLTTVARNREALPHMTWYASTADKQRLWPSVGGLPESEEVLRARYLQAPDDDPLHQMLYVYCQDWLVEDLLMKADRMTMAASLELRVPFLDYRLVEWLARQSPGIKVGAGPGGGLETKRILRDFARRRLPAEIIDRPKQGFPVPIVAWMGSRLGDYAESRLLGPGSRASEMFDRRELHSLVVAGRTGDGQAAKNLWNLLMLEEWARVWLD